MHAFYNEIEPYAAEWMRNLIAAGHLPDGVVDTRSIAELTPADVAGPGQRHFFAGIGVWASALRSAGWPDDVSVWTGSCPCQPFSTAGRGAGFDDERHLWPVWFGLIRECRPPVVVGEQVASPAGRAWLDAVFADLEGAGYACAAANLCAGGVGAPHIRQRLYFVAYAHDAHVGTPVHLQPREPGLKVPDADRGVTAGELAHNDDERRGARRPSEAHGDRPVEPSGRRDARELADSSSARLEGLAGHGDDRTGRTLTSGSTAARGDAGELGDASSSRGGRDAGAIPGAEREGARERELFGRFLDELIPPGPTRGFWYPADWTLCRDGKARPVEPGSFPLASGATARVGRLRATGNAIVEPLAAAFLETVKEILCEN